MIDIRCPCGKATYHVDQSQIGKSLQCAICGRILKLDLQVLGASVLRQIEHVTAPVEGSVSAPPVDDSKVRGQLRDRRIGIGILVSGAIFLGVWLWIGGSRSVPPPTPSTTGQGQSIPSEPAPQMPISDLKPLPLLKHLPVPAELKPKCAEGHSPERLATGMKIEPDGDNSGQSKVKIINGTSSDAAVRLIDNSTNTTSRFVYIRSRESSSIEGMQPGTYSLLFASGSDWVSSCRQFLREENIQEYEKPVVIEEGYNYSATLHAVPTGNVRAKKIDRKRFLQGDQQFSLRP
jgi:hypothetical protein